MKPKQLKVTAPKCNNYSWSGTKHESRERSKKSSQYNNLFSKQAVQLLSRIIGCFNSDACAKEVGKNEAFTAYEL